MFWLAARTGSSSSSSDSNRSSFVALVLPWSVASLHVDGNFSADANALGGRVSASNSTKWLCAIVRDTLVYSLPPGLLRFFSLKIVG